jgi:hypothetical protein
MLGSSDQITSLHGRSIGKPVHSIERFEIVTLLGTIVELDKLVRLKRFAYQR